MQEYQNAKNISIYLSMPSREVSTENIVRDALKSGKRVFVPYLHKMHKPSEPKQASVMDMVMLHSEEDYDALQRDKWGIPTPSRESIVGRKRCLGEDTGAQDQGNQDQGIGIDVIVMPGVAFDTGFGRLGHGKGYYDQFLSRYQSRMGARPGRKASDGSPEQAGEMPFLGKTSSDKACGT
jgi:5-formyltetrahydrofolate cyclo-ligase